jgi:ferrochelatase
MTIWPTDIEKRNGNNAGKIGVLLINLGTPDSTCLRNVRRYLKEFLSDRRVVEANRILWWLVLNLVILNTRPKRSAAAYEAIWNRERDEGPLKTFTRSQAEKLATALDTEFPNIMVDWAMRYGEPSIDMKIEAMKEWGCERILLFPLYPQYSATTTATACDKAFDALKAMRWQPAVRVVPRYFDDHDYISAVAGTIKTGIENLDFVPDVVIASFHGLPVEYVEKGDPYQHHCETTSHLLREKLAWDESRLRIAYQSRVGPKKWLQPYADKTIIQLAATGTRNLAVIAPGFASDCLETLEEINIEYRDLFLENGGKNFAYIPCLNDTSSHMAMLANITRRELGGWI